MSRRRAEYAAEFKLLDSEASVKHGEFTGLASVFGNLDRTGERIARGAFARTLPQFLTHGFLASSHNWDDPIGTISEALETDAGLFVRGEFHSTPAAQLCRTVIRERLERGKSVGMSIGFQTIRDEFKDAARVLTEIELYEVSVVTVPANSLAHLASVKEFEFEEKAWESTENEIRYRVRDPGAFQEDSFRRIQIQKSPPVFAIIGRLKGETTTTIQALRFPKESWEMAKARAWVAEHKDKLKSFEDAESRRITLRQLKLQFLARQHRSRLERSTSCHL